MQRLPSPFRLLLAVVFSAMGYAQTKVEGPIVMFVGPPLSGKSTQAVSAGRLLHLPVVSVNDLIKDNPAVFEDIRRSGVSGMEPESDPVLNRLFQQRQEKGDLAHGMVLDGYPSTKDHCDYLANLVRNNTFPNPLVIELGIPDDVVVQRAGKLAADARAAILQRTKDYHREMDVLHLYFPNADIVHIDATKAEKKVKDEIAGTLKKRFGPGAKHP